VGDSGLYSLSLDELRQRLSNAATAPRVIEPGADAAAALTPAAVLVPIINRISGLTVLLTQRTAHLRDHAGQVSFPGGRREAQDVDAVATALREAQEEVGLDPARIEILGLLPEYRTGTGFASRPWSAWSSCR